MHILFIPSNYPNNYNPVSNVFFREQAEALASFGYKVGVLAIVPITLKQIFKKRKLDFGLRIFSNNDINVFILQLPALPKTQRLQQLLRGKIGNHIFKLYNKLHGMPDIIHVQAFKAAVTAQTIKRIYGIPYVITEHYSALVKAKPYSFEYNVAKNAYINSARRIAVSKYFSNHLTNFFNIDFKYIPNIVDTSFFSPKPYNISNDNNFVILHIANLIKIKNQKMLISAFSKILKLFPKLDIFLRIGGDGPQKKQLVQHVRKLKLEKQVIFLGRLCRDDVKMEMQRCNVFALTSFIETFGIVLIEAMACGKPVVSTKSGGPESIIINSEYGELVDNSVIGIADGLTNVINNINKFNKEKIRRYVENNFSCGAVVKKLDSVYNNLKNPF